MNLLDWLYPAKARCMGCGDKSGLERDWICDKCSEELAKRWIGAFPEEKLNGSGAAYRYEGPAGNIVRTFKYHGVSALAKPMAQAMLRAYAFLLPTGADLIVPVPMHPRRERERGFNQSEVLAKEIAKQLELPWEKAITRTRNTPQQAKLEGKARRDNLKGAFSCSDIVKGRHVLLIDDVYTTGATARECAKMLRKAGANAVIYLAFAKGNTELDGRNGENHEQ